MYSARNSRFACCTMNIGGRLHACACQCVCNQLLSVSLFAHPPQHRTAQPTTVLSGETASC